MPLGPNINATQEVVDRITRPAQIPNTWVQVIDSGGLIIQDGSPITDPDAEITDSTRHKLSVRKQGTILRVRMRRNGAITTPPSIVVFGRYNESDPWQRLFNKDGVQTLISILALASDVTDGTDSYTSPDPTIEAWDLDGCDQILIGVEIAAIGAGAATARLQAKVI